VLPQLQPDSVLGVGTGSTVDRFIDLLAPHRQAFRAAVSSSERSTRRLRAAGIEVLDLNEVASLALYVDGADEIDHQLNMIKGGGGALTREKIVASVADRFVCIVDESKLVERLGAFPLPIEVIPLAREAVARQVRQLGGQPRLREGFVTDNGNQILDVSGLRYGDPAEFEALLNNIPGVVCCGLFAISGAQVALVAGQAGVSRLELRD
jgi:ribose 5-phosphate isomerase A